MKNYMKFYIDYVDEILKEDKKVNYKELKEEHLEKIRFFQHERLVHLLVTLFYALFSILFVFLAFKFLIYVVVPVVLLIFLIFYVVYYFWLENGVQYLYKQYDEICKRASKKKLINF